MLKALLNGFSDHQALELYTATTGGEATRRKTMASDKFKVDVGALTTTVKVQESMCI